MCLCVVRVCVKDEEVVLGRTVLRRSVSVIGRESEAFVHVRYGKCSGNRTFTECLFTKGKSGMG